jgi:adenylate cyclase class 2
MPFEIEAKYRLSQGSEALRTKLASLGAMSKPGFQIVDTYLRHPSRDFAKTGEAFRIRREGDRNHLTYKAPKLKTEGVRTRPEIEVQLAGDDETWRQTLDMFVAMGFEPVATLRKFREPHKIAFTDLALSVEIDDAGELGQFVEIEAMIDDPDQVALAENAIKLLAAKLNLTDYEPRSYLRMWLERQA